MKISIGKLSKMMGVSVRTIHYYDEINLLKPAEITDAGYRFYDENSVALLQQILFFKELEIPLADIKNIISNPNYNKVEVLQCQKKFLLLKKKHIDELLKIVDDTIGGKEMEKINISAEEIETAKKKYAKEVKEKWGNTNAYDEYQKNHSSEGADERAKIVDAGNEIIKEFSAIREENPNGEKAQALVKKWQDYITESYYTCTKEILKGLGQMYVFDERFKKNIDRFGENTAEFMANAIEYYCK